MFIIDKIYKKEIVHRYDDNHIIHYFTYEEFEGLKKDAISFNTPEGNIIAGAFYYYDNYKENELVIFCHGIGGGHRSYMREIEFLARKGYKVLSFDYTGCFESTGKDIRGFCESLNCLDSVLNYIEKDEQLSKLKLHLIGHSWGGYTVGNISNYHQNIASICIISGFTSLKTQINDVFKGKWKFVQRSIYKFEKKANPRFVDSSSLDALKDSKANILIIHSKDDTMVNYSSNAKVVQDSLENPNIKYLIVEGKYHNPNYQKEALSYLIETFSTYEKLIKQKKLKTFEQKKAYMDEKDFFKMTNQDEEVWNEILNNITR